MLIQALDQVEGDIKARVAQYANFAPDTPEGVQLAEDRRRLQAIAQLRTVFADQTRADTIAKSQAAAEQLGKQAVLDQYDLAAGQVRTSAAARGLLGSSQARIAQGQAQATRQTGLKQVITDANDQAAAVRQGDESGYYAALQQVLAPTGGGTGQTAVLEAQNEANNRATVLADQNQSLFGAALSQAVGGFLTNGVAGGVQAGVDRAAALNEKYRQEKLASGPYGPTQHVTPWEALFPKSYP